MVREKKEVRCEAPIGTRLTKKYKIKESDAATKRTEQSAQRDGKGQERDRRERKDREGRARPEGKGRDRKGKGAEIRIHIA